tara:strand:+ start:656 stop:2434 length:1779 start_codon:yes stop_codon:yes gene_type:complete
MKYPKEYLDEIKLRLKVSQVVSKYVQLKKRGKEFIGLSPFKNEKSPSFTVSDEKEFYHCFSTGEHGNIFDFLMKTRSIGFGEAVKILASEAGMQPFKFSNFDEKKEKRFETYKNIFKEYMNFFHLELIKKNENDSYLYLNKKRGLNKNTIEEFKLGYVPWKNNFYEMLLKKYSQEEISLTGLYYKNEKTQKFVDRFNSRIIFPINNLASDTIAFGGRIIKESKMAKYINSPETEFYKKGRVVYNLDNAKSLRSKTNEVIVVEGYMDVVSLNAAGLKNVVSNSGTALTENQIDLIWKFFSSPIICLDGDKSGQRAALRIAERIFPLINENDKIYFSELPSGIDPDDVIKKKGKDEFKKLLKSKKIIQSYIWEMYLKEIDVSNPFLISKFEKKIKNLCYTIKDQVLKKYILEGFLEKIRSLTPIQSANRNYKSKAQKNFRVLNETTRLYKQKDHFTKEQLKEFSILFVMINYADTAQSKIEQLSEIKFSSKESDELRVEILNLLSSEEPKIIRSKINEKYLNLVETVEKNSTLKNIFNKKKEIDKQEILEELLDDLKRENQLKRIKSLENELVKNLDESSYSDLIKLKSQLNSE